MNKIALWISVSLDDWTGESVIILVMKQKMSVSQRKGQCVNKSNGYNKPVDEHPGFLHDVVVYGEASLLTLTVRLQFLAEPGVLLHQYRAKHVISVHQW